MGNAKFIVRRHFLSGSVREKEFDKFDDAKADYERAQDQDRVERCEIIDCELGQVMREWVVSPPDQL
jgi:hypothetical protein